MANVIAIIWDFDKTLVQGYMQAPIFKHYKLDGKKFWEEVHALPQKYLQEQNVKVNRDTIYLNHFINYSAPGKPLFGLNNAQLREFGKELEFFPGVLEFFKNSKEKVAQNSTYQEYGIKVEHYIVSTGFAETIKGSSIMEFVDGVWGCEIIEHESEGKRYLGEIAYTIDNTTKTRAIFEINKGVPKHPEINVNDKMAKDMRRVPFENMIYIADGPSDIPAFALINRFGGSTFAIYPKGDLKAFEQVEKMRRDGRIQMYAEADYSEGTTAYMWITNKIDEYAQRMYQAEKAKLARSVSKGPAFLE